MILKRVQTDARLEMEEVEDAARGPEDSTTRVVLVVSVTCVVRVIENVTSLLDCATCAKSIRPDAKGMKGNGSPVERR